MTILSQDERAIEVPADAVMAALAEIAAEARDYVRAAKAENTQRAYRADWADFAAWCARHNLTARPAAAETVVLYLTDLAATRTVATLQRRLAAIAQAHKAADLETPTAHPQVRALMAGIRRTKGTAPRVKTPALVPDLQAMVAALPDTLRGRRDRALLLLGFAGAFRRSELVGLDVDNVVETSDGLVVTIRKGKTDQEGQGRKVGIPYGAYPQTCPVRAVRAWREASGIMDGALFRGVDRAGRLLSGRLSDRAVALVVKRGAKAIGKEPREFSGHSLRAGLATAAATAGKSERLIMAQTGHKSLPIVRRYIRDGSLFTENAAAGLGL